MTGIAFLCVAYVLSQFFRSFLAVLTTVLSADLGVTATELAYASGAWFLAFALSQFPVGILLDTIGPKRTAGYIFTLFAGGGTFLFAAAWGPVSLIIAMAMIGIGCAPVLMAPFYIFVRVYSPAKLATYVSLFISIGMLGNVAGSEPLALAVEAFGWRNVSAMLAILSMIIGLGALFFTVDPEKPDIADVGGGFLDVLKIRKLWPIFPIILVGYAVAAGIRGLWVGPYLSDVYQLNTLEIGRITLFMSIALVFGTLFYGPLDRIFSSRKWVVLIGNLIILMVCIFMANVVFDEVYTTTIVFIVIGLFGASYAVQMAHGRAFVPPHLTGRGVTLLNFCAIGGAGFMQWLSGSIVEYGTVPGEPVAAYQFLFAFYAIVMASAIVVYLFSTDAKP